MRDHEKFKILIYHEGVESTVAVRGKKRYLEEKAFLDNLVGRQSASEALPCVAHDARLDFYMLDDERIAVYSIFKRNRRKSEIV